MLICQLDPCEPEWKMWRWMLPVVLLVHIALPQPLTDGDSGSTSQYNFGECCPCPDSNGESSFRSQSHWYNPMNNNGRNFMERSRNPGQFNNGFSPSTFDDCPCRFRGADSEGSSSIFFPSALRPTGSLSKPADSKEDLKNLLEPEVGLASSVLETLREVTDEEYRDALARDAARARATEDATPEESAQNIVTIILPSSGDEEDFMPASHIQEPRCIHPLGSTLSRMRMPLAKSPNILTEILRMPNTKDVGLLHKDILNIDNGLGASNVQERIVDMNGRNRKIKTSPAILHSEVDDVCEVRFQKGTGFKPISLLEKETAFSPSSKMLKSANIPKTNMRTHEDMKSAASNVKDQFSDSLNPGFKLEPLTSENSPIHFKNLLKLRDVELISPGQLIEKLKLGQPNLQLPTLIENMPKLSDLLKNGIKFDLNKIGKWNNAKNDDKSIEQEKSGTNIQVIPRDKTMAINILDAMPSTSNINEVVDSCEIPTENQAKAMSEVKTMQTDILDSIPNSFQTIDNNNRDISDNELGQEVKSVEVTDCELTEKENMASDEMFSCQRRDSLIPAIQSQEDIQSNTQNDVTEQDLGASNCLESIHDGLTKSAITKEIFPEADPASVIGVEARDSKTNSYPGVVNTKKSENNNDKLKNVVINNNKSPLSRSLISVRESIFKKIEDRKKALKLNDDITLRDSNAENLGIKNSEEDCDKEPSNDDSSVLLNPLDTEGKNVKTPKDSSTMRLADLQKLSDSLLKKSLLKEKSAPVIDNSDCDDDVHVEMSIPASRKNNLLDNNRDSKMDSNTESSNRQPTEMKNAQNLEMARQNSDNSGQDNKGNLENSCLNNVVVEDSTKFLRTGPAVSEMTAAASEPVMGTQWHDPLNFIKDTLQGSPLFQNIIVQPPSLFEGINNLQNIELGKTLNLPTLDDIRERLANVFGKNDKDSTADDNSCDYENPVMSAEPSITKFISRSPTTPLEDLNLDIFQLKPLTAGKSSTLSKIPSLNLKSFKAKVPIPNNIDLKPLRLQSTVGNEGGLLGATLTLGRDSGSSPKLFESLGNPLHNLPGLDDIISKSFVNNPLDLSRSIDTIPRISHISDNLRSNTENTIRALQQRMDSTLGQASNLLSTSPKRPQELIDKIADAKDDFDAKLKGLHYDLNDRLTSIHEDILDRAGLVSLNPLFQEGGLSSRNLFNNNQNLGNERKPTTASKKNKLQGKKEILSKTANYKSRTSGGRKVDSNSSQRKFKMPASASVPVPKTVEVPKLKSSLDKSLFNPVTDLKTRPVSTRMKPLGLVNTLDTSRKQSSKPFQEKSVTGKQASSFKEKKIKVTFGSTTPSPISSIRSQQRSSSDIKGSPTEVFSSTGNGLARRLGLKSRNDPNGSPSEVQPTRIQPPRTAVTNCKDDMNSMEDTAESRSPTVFKNENRENKMREVLKQQNNAKSSTNLASRKTNGRSTDESPISPLPSWPKVDEKSFLNKIRDAIKARLSSFDPKKSSGDSESKTRTDMARSASENNAVVVGDSLKENVSYKCKMVCTKS